MKKQKTPKYIATKHAYKRAKERFSWKPNVLDKMMKKAYEKGIKYGDMKGTLKTYIKGRRKYGAASTIRIYGENIFFFSSTTLITLYRIPSKLTKYLQPHR